MAQLEITAMSFGPYGIGRLNGKTVMAAGVVPGDILDVETATQRRDYAIAQAAKIIRPSDKRRDTPCRFLPRCGGCDWQQIEYAEQVELKAGLIAHEFHRALGIAVDPHGLVEPAPAEFDYRSRIRLKVSADGRLGFHQFGANVLVEIDHCMVAAPGIRIPLELAALLKRSCVEMEIVAGEAGEVVVAWLKRAPVSSDAQKVSAIVDANEWLAGVVLRKDDARIAIGDVEISLEVEPGCVLRAAADVFSQANPAQNLKLVAAVMAMAGIEPETRVLDLFCGAGNFAIPAARRGAQVTGADNDAHAIAAARDNAARMQLGAAQFVAMRASEAASFHLRTGSRPQVVILDPPRVGALELMSPLARLRPAKVVYVSCDPSTLVRDLRSLVAQRYAIEEVRAFDFFPNTHHVEVAVSALLT